MKPQFVVNEDGKSGHLISADNVKSYEVRSLLELVFVLKYYLYRGAISKKAEGRIKREVLARDFLSRMEGIRPEFLDHYRILNPAFVDRISVEITDILLRE